MIQTPESLIVEDAVLTYGKGEFATPALRGVSLTAKPGEVLLLRAAERRRFFSLWAP